MVSSLVHLRAAGRHSLRSLLPRVFDGTTDGDHERRCRWNHDHPVRVRVDSVGAPVHVDEGGIADCV